MHPTATRRTARRPRATTLAALGMVLAVTAACETAGERALREEREAYKESLDLDELRNSLETVNPDPYNDGTIKKHYGGHNR